LRSGKYAFSVQIAMPTVHWRGDGTV